MEKARESQTTSDVIHWTYSQNKEGKHPVKLRVTHARVMRYYPVQFEGRNLFLTPAEWKALEGRPRKVLKHIQDTIKETEVKAEDARKRITANNTPFSFERFEAEYLLQESKQGFLATFRNHLETLKSDNRIGTFRAYANALAAFNAFRGGDKDRPGRDLAPIDLTPALLKQFETYMLQERETGRNTVAMYMRALRVIYNLCAESNASLKEFYPFATRQNDRNRYKIRTAAGKKAEALEVEQLQGLIDTNPDKDSPEYEAKQLFLFSFYAQGMNLRDIALLKYQDIKGQTITYLREKTKRSETEETPLEIPLTEPLRQIIRSIGNPEKKPENYVFEILKHGLTPLQQDSRIRDKIKKVNKALKSLCEEADLPVITGYAARHSYATMLRDSGQSIETIKEMLGHSDTRVTEAYLARFDTKRKREINERLQSLFSA